MSRITPLKRADLPDHESQFALVEAAMGFVPSSMLTMARVPGLMEAFGSLGATVLYNDVIDNGLKQMVGMMASIGGGCRYCQAHTSHTAARLGVPEAKLAAIWDFETNDLFDDAERAALRLAFHAGQVPNAVSDEDVAACRRHFTEEEVAAIVAVCALFGYLNRWNDTMATTLEEAPGEFGGRVLAGQGWEPGPHG